MSAFELGRGCTPRLHGHEGISTLSKSVVDACLDSKAFRKLKKALTSSKSTKLAPKSVKIGDRALGCIEKSFGKFGAWKEHRVCSVPDDRLAVSVKPGPHVTRLAPEDVQIVPQNYMAARAFRPQNDMSKCRCARASSSGLKRALHDEGHSGDSSESCDTSEDDEENGIDIHASEDSHSDHENPNQAQSVEMEVEERPEPMLGRSSRLRRPTQRCIESMRGAPLSLKPEKGRWCFHIAQKHGSKQFARWQAPEMSAWFYDAAMEEELENWKKKIKPIHINELPPDANLASSHTVRKLKVNDDGARRFKARTCPYGNHDRDKGKARADSEVAAPASCRMMLSMAALHSVTLLKVDVKEAFMQSGPIERAIRVRPPKDAVIRHNVVAARCGAWH